MTTQYASSIYPVPNRFIGIGKETAGPGSVATATYTLPLTSFKPDDKVTYLPDAAWRNSMGDLYNLVQGVEIADISLAGPFFADGFGYVLADMMGDYYQSVNGGVTGTTTTLSGSVASGATTIVLANSGSGVAVDDLISVGSTGTTAEEVRQVTAIAGGTATLNMQLYQGHASGGTVTVYSSWDTITHSFAQLNTGSGMGGFNEAQPPTYSFTDYTGVPASTGARQYAYSVFSEVALTSNATALLEWDGKLTAVASEIAATTPTTSISDVAPQAAWNTTVTIAGSGTYNTEEWKLTLQRKITPKFENAGQQAPYAIPRGALSAMLNFTFDPASDEEEYLPLRNATIQTLVLNCTNGQTGTAATSINISATKMQVDTSVIEDTKEDFGWTNTAKLIENTTDTGPSGGYGPCVISVTNRVIAY